MSFLLTLADEREIYALVVSAMLPSDDVLNVISADVIGPNYSSWDRSAGGLLPNLLWFASRIFMENVVFTQKKIEVFASGVQTLAINSGCGFYETKIKHG